MNTSALGSVYGKEARANLHFRIGLEQLVRERRERAFQVRHRDAVADDEPLDLLEHRRVRQVEVVAAVDLTGHDNPYGRLVALHVANLHRRGVRAEERGRPSEPRDLAGEYRVSCISAAGMLAGMLSASKLW
jgi:hypothetical protein